MKRPYLVCCRDRVRFVMAHTPRRAIAAVYDQLLEFGTTGDEFKVTALQSGKTTSDVFLKSRKYYVATTRELARIVDSP